MTDKRLGVLSRTFSTEHQAEAKTGLLSRLVNSLATPTVYPVGPDVSYWQGIIDWDIMAERAKFVIIRAGIGNSAIDARLEYNVTNAAALGIPYGLYWYVKPAHDALKHAGNFAAVVQTYGGTIPPTFDLEETGGLDKNALYNWYAKLYNRFAEVSGLEFPEMMTYTSAGFLNNAIPLTNFIKWTKLWVATWGAAPIIPNEWAKSGKTWTYWQYTNKGDGALYGAQSKSIDLNRKNEQIPEPPGEDMKYKVVKLVNKRKDHNVNSEFLGQREVGEIVTPVETWGDVKYPGAYWALGQDGAWSIVQYYNPTVVYMQAFV